MPALHHPNVHSPASAWSEEQTLHVAACYSNPFRWQTRREITNDFRRHMAQSPNVDLHFVELAYGDRPFDVTDKAVEPKDIQLRTATELFHKENLLNIAIRSFPPSWKYGAIIDADFHFTRHDWALEAIHMLQHHEWVQLFSTYTNLSDSHAPLSTTNSFAYNYVKAGCSLPIEWQDGWCTPPYGVRKNLPAVGAPGGAWAFRRSAFDAVGGLLEKCILGSGDWFMAFGLVGSAAAALADGRGVRYTRDYFDTVRSWQIRAQALRRNIGYLDCHVVHHWHGPIKLRGYGSRDQILVDNDFQPTFDVSYDWQGVLQLTPEKPKLRDDIRRYFLSRDEDVPDMG